MATASHLWFLQRGCRHQFSAVSAHGDTEGKSGLVVVVTELMSCNVS